MYVANKKIKILYGLEAADAGALKHLTYLVTHLDKDLFDVSVILSPKRSGRVNIDIDKMQNHGATVIRLPMERSIHVIKDILALYHIYVHVFKNNYDIVHAHSSKAGVLFRVAAWLNGGSVTLYTPHCFYFQSKTGFTRKFFSWIERLMSKITTRLIVSNNERFSAIHNDIAPPEKIININNAISFDDYHQKTKPDDIKRKFKIPSENIIIGAIGRLTEQKDWVTYIQTAYETIKEHQNITFLIVGEGELQNDLKQLINKLDLENHILITGHIDDISEVYSIIDIFVSTSLWEGLPYVILEAMWFKKPIIASNLGYAGVLYNKENSLLVKHGSPHEIAAAIIELLNDKELIKEMGEKSHQLINSHFRFENFIKLHEQLYKLLTNRPFKSNKTANT